MLLVVPSLLKRLLDHNIAMTFLRALNNRLGLVITILFLWKGLNLLSIVLLWFSSNCGPLPLTPQMCNKLLLKAIQATEPKKKKPKRPKNPEELLGSGGGSLKSPKKPPPVVPPSFTSSSRYAKPPRRGGSSDDEESDDDEEEEEQQKQKPPRRRRPKNSQAHMVEGEGGVDETGKLIILVEDFYYGVYRGANSEKRTADNAITFKCHLCDKRLKNNLK